MSVRLQAILGAVAFVALVLLWFFFGFNPNRSRISELEEQQEQVQTEINDLRITLERLLELRRQEPQLRAELTRMRDALPTDPRLPDFILQVQEAANLAGIDFLSITPSLPAPFTPPGGTAAAAGQLQAISVSISTTGRYFEIEDFLIRMERLRRAVRINTFALAPGGGSEEDPDDPRGSPTLSVTFALQMFVNAPPAPPAGQPATTPPPDASPAPGTPPPGSPPPADGSTPAPTASPEAA